MSQEPTFLPSLETERAATRLERHLEWHKGFWLAYVFTISPPQAHILQERVGAKLRGQGRKQRVLRPQTPQALEAVLSDVLGAPRADCVWVESVRGPGSSGPENATWCDAWTSLVLRANERRELLRDGLGGLVLVAEPSLKGAIRDAGPDLWSVRQFVFELPPSERVQRGSDALRETIIRADGRSTAPFVDRELLDTDMRLVSDAVVEQDPITRAKIEEKLAMRLASAGRHRDALDALSGLVEFYRALAEEHPDEYLPDLARTRGLRGHALAELDEHQEALRAAQEALDAYRELVEGRPDEFLPDFARSLDVLGARLSNLGRHEDALRATQEAVDAYRKLNERWPKALFLHEVARALDNLGIRLSKLGKREEALRVTQEALEAYRGLAEQRPDAFLPDLAIALNNLGLRLSDLGRPEEALQAAQEAVDTVRGLAEQRPEVFLPNLAMTMGALGSVHATAERPADALDAIAEGLRLILPLAAHPSHPLGTLAINLARDLRQVARAAKLSVPEDLVSLLDQLLGDQPLGT
ncbi:tetratricopeptide repeat protein [Paraliomyxa miuraensis]|uniref:tetratricopeptide repeat protein n=1 Tax=Paraliomyxa miuraensis TaxID=376150 RepID=UPI0022531A3F|nr:tetratricopeptide repeat protein [Paraliomyxa miuraensis]MCX4244504.1 tetratricopeptide repeat protein [Paraliomyxa miuraensis]